MPEQAEISDWREKARQFSYYVLRRFDDDRCLRVAASLSYTSLLAVVPLTAIVFAMLAAFPVFEGMRGEFQTAIFSNFLPQSAQAMREYFDRFILNAAGLTAVGIIGLALTAVLLLGTIESSLNTIFRVSRPRALLPRLLVFWALLTLGPLMLGASFSLSTYIFAATKWMGLDVFAGPMGGVTKAAPMIIIMAVLSMFFLIIPNCQVNFRDAVIGGVTSGLLFSLLRKVFGFYVTSFPTYQTIYGAVSVVPIFLVWMYFSWIVVLLGAVLTASLGEWRSAGGMPSGRHLDSGLTLVVALQILAQLLEEHRKGGVVPRERMAVEEGISGVEVDRLLMSLKESGFVEHTTEDNWLLTRDLAGVSVADLFDAMALNVNLDNLDPEGDGWRQKLLALMQAQRDVCDVSLETFLTGEGPESGVRAGKITEIRPVS